MPLKCTTCGIMLTSEEGFVKFNCPSCNDNLIVRCKTCKKLSRNYVCKKCKFKGP